MAVVQFIAYANLTINFRAIAAGLTGVAMITDALAVLVTFFIVRRVAQSEGYDELAGMVLGGTLAAWFGIWITQSWGP